MPLRSKRFWKNKSPASWCSVNRPLACLLATFLRVYAPSLRATLFVCPRRVILPCDNSLPALADLATSLRTTPCSTAHLTASPFADSSWLSWHSLALFCCNLEFNMTKPPQNRQAGPVSSAGPGGSARGGWPVEKSVKAFLRSFPVGASCYSSRISPRPFSSTPETISASPLPRACPGSALSRILPPCNVLVVLPSLPHLPRRQPLPVLFCPRILPPKNTPGG